MYQKFAHKQYNSVHITTVDRGKLLVMLYDGCLNFLRHCKDGLEARDLPKFATNLSKAQAIISELMITLDFEKGGSIAKDLDRLYDFMLFYLTEANLEKNPAKIGRVIEVLDTVASGYREIISRHESSGILDGVEPRQTKAPEPVTIEIPGQTLRLAL